jgi:hypothetical protein
MSRYNQWTKYKGRLSALYHDTEFTLESCKAEYGNNNNSSMLRNEYSHGL